MQTPVSIHLLFVCLLAALLAACAGPSAPQPVTLRYAIPDDSASQASAEALRTGFAAANPGITIELRPLPAATYIEALNEQLASGSPPDIIAHPAQYAPLLRRDQVLLDLSAHGVSAGDLSPATLEPWRDGEKLYGLPQDAVPTMMFYNRALFDAAGVAYPQENWDWTAWRETARRLSDPARGQYGTALSGWDGLIWGNGGEIFNADFTKTMLDQPAATAGVQFGADLINIDQSAPLPQIAGGPDPIKLFRDGQLALLPSPSTLIAELQGTPPGFAWDIAPMPAGVVRATRLTVSGIGVNAKTTNPEAAARFISWAGSSDGLAAHIKAFPYAVPPRPSVAPAELLNGASGPAGGKFVVGALSYGRVQPFVPEWAAINDTINTALIPVWKGEEPAASAYKRIAPAVNSLLEPRA